MIGALILTACTAGVLGTFTGWVLRVTFEPRSIADMRDERESVHLRNEVLQHDLHVMQAELAFRDAAEAS